MSIALQPREHLCGFPVEERNPSQRVDVAAKPMETMMRTLALAVAGLALAVPGITHAADLNGVHRVASVERGYYSDGGYYRGRGMYQDSGWAYEVPVTVDHNCRVRIIATAHGLNRIRRCL